MDISVSSLAEISIIVPAVFGTVLIKNLNPILMVLYTFIVSTLVLAVVSEILEYKGVDNLFIYHSYIYIEYTAVSIIYFQLFDNWRMKGVVISFFALFILFSIFKVEYPAELRIYHAGQRYLESSMVFILSVAYFAQIMRRAEHLRIEQQPTFWINVGFVIYFSVSAFLFLVGGQIIKYDLRNFWEIHSGLTIGLNVIFTITLVKGSNRFKEINKKS